MLRLGVRMFVGHQHRSQFLEVVRGMLEPTRVEEGCLDCRLRLGPEDEDPLVLIEEWRDIQALERHLHGPGFGALLIAMDVLDAPPELSVDLGQRRLELDSVEDIYRLVSRAGTEARTAG
jgi:quinol monooxygenase YgiN